MFNKENMKWLLIMAYMVGAAMTYNHALRAGRETIVAPGDTSTLILKSMFSSFVWPLYWLARAIGA
jgi:hypothetical protein